MTNATPTRRRPTLDDVYLFCAVALVGLRPLLTPVPPNDFWWHIATGRTIWNSGAVPLVDAFSFTRADEPYFNQPWLAQVLMYGLHSAGGLPLMIIVQALVIALSYALLLRLCIIRSGRPRLCVALLLLAVLPLSFDNWTIRPQSYVFLLFVGLLTVLSDYRRARPPAPRVEEGPGVRGAEPAVRSAAPLWLLPLIMVLWVNMHGSFVLGFVLIAIVGAGALLDAWPNLRAALPHLRALTLWGAIAALATLLNPRGPGVIGYVRDLLGTSAVTNLVTEWAPPTVRDINGALFFLFVIFTLCVLAYARQRPDTTDIMLTLAFLWLALGATRNIVWLGFVAAPLLAVQLASILPAPKGPLSAGEPRLNALLIGVVGLLVVLGLPWVKPLLLPPNVGALVAEETPVAAVRALRALPVRPQRLFHALPYGSYLIWAAPEQPVFIDPRIELYPLQQWRDYINLAQANDLPELLKKYQIDGVLLNVKQQAPLLAALERAAGWRVVYADDITVLLVRDL